MQGDFYHLAVKVYKKGSVVHCQVDLISANSFFRWNETDTKRHADHAFERH